MKIYNEHHNKDEIGTLRAPEYYMRDTRFCETPIALAS